MSMKTQPYRNALARDVVRLWNRALCAHFPMTLRLFRQNTQGAPSYRPDDSAVITSGDEVIAYVLTKRFREEDTLAEQNAAVGWVEALVVDPAWQRQGLGSDLLAWARDRLRGDGAQRIVAGGGFSHFCPGVPTELPGVQNFFASAGFQTMGTVHDLRGNLAGFLAPPSARAAVAAVAGETAPCRPADVPALLAFMRAEFPGRWRYDIERYLAVRGEPGDIIVLRHDQRVIGFAQIHHSRSPRLGPPIYWHRLLGRYYGGLGPIGIAADMRGKGLGLALLQLSLEHVARLGVRDAVIDWTSLVDFYAGAGFVPWKTYVRMQR